MLKCFFIKKDDEDNLVIITDGKTAKIFDGDQVETPDLFFNDIDLNEPDAQPALWRTFHELWLENELPDYEELYSPIVVEYTDEIEAECNRGYTFFEVDDDLEPPVAEGEYASIRKEHGKEVARLAAAIRPAGDWNDVMEECEKIAKMTGLEEEWDDPDIDMQTFMELASEIFGVKFDY